MPDLKCAIDGSWAYSEDVTTLIATTAIEDIVQNLASARATLDEVEPEPTQPRGKAKAA